MPVKRAQRPDDAKLREMIWYLADQWLEERQNHLQPMSHRYGFHRL